MNILITLIVLSLAACTSDPSKNQGDAWDSGASKARSFEDEGSAEQDEAARNQFPKSF